MVTSVVCVIGGRVGQDIPWERVTLFLLDERFTDPESTDSNTRLVRETLLAPGSAAWDAVKEFLTPSCRAGISVQESVQEYEERLRAVVESGGPHVCVYGLGPDGHFVSLFPPVPRNYLDTDALVLHTTTDVFAVRDRITVTFPFMTANRDAKNLFLLSGEEKKNVWVEMEDASESSSEERWPVLKLLSFFSSSRVVALVAL